jgi:hypothetical protein
MTNLQALINITAGKVVAEALLIQLVGADAAAELMSGVVTTAAAEGIVGELNDSQTTYDANPDTFVDTPANIDALDDAIDALAALEVTSIEAQSGDAYAALQAASPEA